MPKTPWGEYLFSKLKCHVAASVSTRAGNGLKHSVEQTDGLPKALRLVDPVLRRANEAGHQRRLQPYKGRKNLTCTRSRTPFRRCKSLHSRWIRKLQLTNVIPAYENRGDWYFGTVVTFCMIDRSSSNCLELCFHKTE